MKRNAVVAQSGGPSPVINASLQGVIEGCLHHPGTIGRIFAGRHGIEGVLQEELIDLSAIDPGEIALLRHTPAAGAVGTCRYKLKDERSEDYERIIEVFKAHDVGYFFYIGGNDSMDTAQKVSRLAAERGLDLAVTGVPKTIDNDIDFVYKTFGFDTAVGRAREVLDGAHAEAVGAPNGIGLVKLMGRDSGFIAAYATLASLEVNFCLIPEVPFDLNGPGAFLQLLEARLKQREHAVVVVAEGAGQDLMQAGDRGKDASGNVRHEDIGEFLKERIQEYFAETSIPINLKYFDPSYIVRSIPANASDCIFCDNLARNAVHAGMAGKTDMLIGLWHGVYVHVPIALAIRERKRIRPQGSLWSHVLEVTGQPMSMKARA